MGPPRSRGGLGGIGPSGETASIAPGQGVFARVYVHAGMVSYHGEKMSKSLGNLVFVSRLLADGTDPMAIRMVLLAHHYRSDWEWTDAALGDGQARLTRWRAALARAEAAVPYADPGAAPASAAEMVLAGVRARLRDDLDAPGALAVVDRWADALLAEPPTRIAAADLVGAHLVQAAVDALLGVSLSGAPVR
jgi:L-cysteine:1D-myo-inositol 2-amino-2-deoxy-alpha-D-glucopyranoside ligase